MVKTFLTLSNPSEFWPIQLAEMASKSRFSHMVNLLFPNVEVGSSPVHFKLKQTHDEIFKLCNSRWFDVAVTSQIILM